MREFKIKRWDCVAVFVVTASLLLCDRAGAVDLEDAVGVWTVSIDLSGIPQFAQLEIKEVAGTLRATLSSDFGAAEIDDITLAADKLLMVYDVKVGHESKAVKLALEMTANGLAGWAFTGTDDLSMAWPVRAAKVGSGVEAALRSEYSAKQRAFTRHTPTLPTNEAREFLGVWELALRREGIDNSPSFPMWLVIQDVKGKVVVGLSGFSLRGPWRTVYDVARLPGGLRWTYEADLLGALNMDISGGGDEISVQLTTGSGEPFLIGTGSRKNRGAEVGIDLESLTQEPHVELIGKIGDRARVVEIEEHQVRIQEKREVTILAVNNPLLVRFPSFRLPEGMRLVSVKGHVACVVEKSMVRLLDVSQPTAPRVIGSCKFPGNQTGEVKHGGPLVFAENWNGQADTQQVQVVDVSGQLAPSFLSSYDTPQGANNYDIAVSGSTILVANASGLLIIDVSKPDAPKLLSRFKAAGRFVRGVEVRGSLAYLATSVTSGVSWLEIVDIADPASPFQVSLCETEGGAQDVAVSGSLAYVADLQAGLVAVDISDPAKLQRRGFFQTEGRVHKVAVSGDLAFVEVTGDREQDLAILKYSR